MRLSCTLLGLAVLACTPSINPNAISGAAAPPLDASLSGDDAGEGDASDGEGYGADAADPWWDAGEVVPTLDGAAQVAAGNDASSARVEAGPEGACTHALGAGDLLIDELMIESVAGAGDDGEWLEISNTAGCAVDLHGLHGECPVGAKVHTFDVTEDVWILPSATFVVADSEDPAINHDLPGVVLAWSGHPGDVLRNQGGTVTLTVGDVLVDSLTWPSMKLGVGASVELPADCPASDADSFDAWQAATASWFPGFSGTPNAPNTDVQCP